MKRVASFSTLMLLLSTLFIFAMPIPQAQAAACTSPTQSTFTETGTAYTVQTFTTAEGNCTWTIPSNVSSIRVVIVGGGGGAGFGACGGGGGAGRVIISNSRISVTPNSSLSLTIGNGGLGGWRGASDWRMGISGETSSATINGTTYLASGGGAGAGGATASGLSGGSGGGGTACTTAPGGAADTSLISGFTSYANAGGTGNSSGGGGGGAGTAGVAGSGGNGVTLWGATFAGGGGGWGNGTGGTGGGGSATSATDTKANSGSAGTAGTGSGGGGGNDGGCGRIMIRYIVDTSIQAPTISGSPIKGITIVITVNANTPGRVRFFIAGKRAANCLSQATTGSFGSVTATCSWKPATRGFVELKAQVTPTDTNYPAAISAVNKVFVLNRATTR
jgi:hypothetical protein